MGNGVLVLAGVAVLGIVVVGVAVTTGLAVAVGKDVARGVGVAGTRVDVEVAVADGMGVDDEPPLLQMLKSLALSACMLT